MAAQAFVVITGNTYPVKDQLKELGGRWEPTQRGWIIPAKHEAQARKLVAEAPMEKRPPHQQSFGFRHKKTWRPCGYPGCNPSYCDECSGRGA